MERAKNDVLFGIDAMKLLCAFLIVYLHTYNHDWGAVGEWIHVNLSTAGVPFFFIVSGFLYIRGLRNASDMRDYFHKYLKRVLYMYLFWSIITLPISWMNVCIAHGDYSSLLKIVYIVRCLFFTGSIGIYWYVLALIYNSIIFYYALKWRKINVLYILALFFFIIGVLYVGGGIKDSLVEKVIHVVIGSERNFLNIGLFYMCIGGLIYEKNLILSNRWCIILLAICLIVSSLIYSFSPYRIIQLPIAVLLFMWAFQWNLGITKETSLGMRKWSTALYLGHFPFLLVFDYYLKRGTMIDFSLSVVFSLSLFYVLSLLLNQRYVKMIYGS